jgi:hypothetical protein
MPTANHVDALFSVAVDDELTPEQEQRFHDHLADCAECAASYQAFTAAVGKVRSLPRAAMPLPVHLPSGAPTAERATATDWLRRLVPKRLPMGAATGVAALAAVAIVAVALTRGAGPATTNAPAPTGLSQSNRGAGSSAGEASPASCPVAAPAGSTASYANRATASDRSRPGQQLVLSASELAASPGSQIQVSAVLTVPGQAAGQPGAVPAIASTAITPCLSITGLPAPELAAPVNGPAFAQGAAGAGQTAHGAETLTIPPGTPPGTVIHVVATVPANYPSTAQAPLTATLDITVR